MPNKQKKFGPLTHSQHLRKEAGIAKTAARRAAKAAAHAVVKIERRARPKRASREALLEAPARRGNVGMPIGSGGQFQITAKWPRTYVSAIQEGKNAAAYKFCVPLCRYGVDTATTPGAGAMSFIGTTAKFAQLLALGPGVTYNQPGTSLKAYDNVSWLNVLLATYAQNWVEYRMRRLVAHVVPNNATTASARSYWMAFYEDPSIAMCDSYTATGGAAPMPSPFSLTTMQSSGNALVFPAWQANSLSLRPRPEWLKVNQVFRDSTDAGTTVLTWATMQSYLQLHSFGALAMVSDYTNAGGAPILDGYVFLEGEVELRESAPLLVTTSSPALAVPGRLTTCLVRNPVTDPNVQAQVDSLHLGEMKTSEAATTQGRPAPLPAPRSIPPLSQFGMAFRAASADELEKLAQLILEEKRQRDDDPEQVVKLTDDGEVVLQAAARRA